MSAVGEALSNLTNVLFPESAAGTPQNMGLVFAYVFLATGIVMIVLGLAGMIMKFLGIVDITSMLGVFGENDYRGPGGGGLQGLASTAQSGATWFALGGMAIAVFHLYLGWAAQMLMRFLFLGIAGALGAGGS